MKRWVAQILNYEEDRVDDNRATLEITVAIRRNGNVVAEETRTVTAMSDDLASVSTGLVAVFLRMAERVIARAVRLR